MFSIFEYVILFFLKHSNFMVFFYVIHKGIMQIGKAKTSEDLRGPWQDEEWSFKKALERLYKGMNFVPKFQDNLHKSKHKKKAKKHAFQHPEHTQKRPNTWNGALGAHSRS